MEDGDVKLNESVAIMTYILERYGASPLCWHTMHICYQVRMATTRTQRANRQLKVGTGMVLFARR
jgi:glutathione S-transferase